MKEIYPKFMNLSTQFQTRHLCDRRSNVFILGQIWEITYSIINTDFPVGRLGEALTTRGMLFCSCKSPAHTASVKHELSKTLFNVTCLFLNQTP